MMGWVVVLANMCVVIPVLFRTRFCCYEHFVDIFIADLISVISEASQYWYLPGGSIISLRFIDIGKYTNGPEAIISSMVWCVCTSRIQKALQMAF